MARVFNVLFVCTANSARSLMAEAVLLAQQKLGGPGCTGGPASEQG